MASKRRKCIEIEEKKEEKVENENSQRSDEINKEEEKLNNDINKLVSNDIRRKIWNFNKELADRLYSNSIDGNELNKFDYETVCFVSKMDKKLLTKQLWNEIVKSLNLKQTVPFNKSQWKLNKIDEQKEDKVCEVINKYFFFVFFLFSFVVLDFKFVS